MVLLSALSLTPLISKMGLFTALTTCKAFSILPDITRSINGSIYYCCYYYAIILLAPIYALPLPRYILSSKTQQNRIWISDSKLSPNFLLQNEHNFPKIFAFTVKEKQKLKKQLTGFTGWNMSGANSRRPFFSFDFVPSLIHLPDSSHGNKTTQMLPFFIAVLEACVPRFCACLSHLVHLVLCWDCLFTKTMSFTFVSSTTCRMPGTLFGSEWKIH